MTIWTSLSLAFKAMSSPAWLPFWEVFEFCSIVLVIVACWGEGWADHHKFPDEFASPKPPKLKKDIWMKRFWRLLIIGLTAEMIGFLFSFLASNQEIERLKTDNANLFIIASQAGKAADRAKESSAQAIEAAEKAKTERLLAEKENLGLRTKLIELEIKAGKRHLTDEQKTSVRRSLIGVTGGRILFNNMAMGDEETVEYEKELIEFLNQIGFDAKEAGGFISEIPEFLGMQFRVKAINLVPPFAGAILEAFKDAGINVSGFAGSDMADAKTIEIRIGKKPPY